MDVKITVQAGESPRKSYACNNRNAQAGLLDFP